MAGMGMGVQARRRRAPEPNTLGDEAQGAGERGLLTLQGGCLSCWCVARPSHRAAARLARLHHCMAPPPPPATPRQQTDAAFRLGQRQPQGLAFAVRVMQLPVTWPSRPACTHTHTPTPPSPCPAHPRRLGAALGARLCGAQARRPTPGTPRCCACAPSARPARAPWCCR